MGQTTIGKIFMTTTPKTFMRDAEELLRREMPSKGLSVWRGQCTGFLYPYHCYYECIVARFMEGDSPPTPPQSSLAVQQEWNYVYIWTEDGSSFTPFGGGWDPLKELRTAVEKIPSFK